MSIPMRLHDSLNIDSVGQKSGFYQNMDIPLNIPLTNPLSDTLQQGTIAVPAVVHNMDLSTITLNYTVPSPAAAVNIFDDVLGLEPFSSISYESINGNKLCYLTNPTLQARVFSKIDTPLSQFMSNDENTGFHLPQSSVAFGNAVPIPYSMPAGNAFNSVTGSFYAANTYPQPNYLRCSPATGAQCVSRVIPLSQLSGTIFALKHDQFNGAVCNLNLTTAPIKNFGFTSATPFAPGPTGWVGPASATALTAATNAITLNSITLNLAVQMDQDIVNMYQSRARNGNLSYQVPWITAMSVPVAIGNVGVNVSLSSAVGSKMKRLVTVFQTATPGLSPYDISNFNGSKVSAIGTVLNSNQLQKKNYNNCLIPLYTAQGNVQDDYRENKKFMKNSCLQDYNAYAQNWFWCDSFSDRSNIPSLSSEKIDEGVRLIPGQTTYMLNVVAVQALTCWTFIETIRHLEITPGGPQWKLV